MNTVNIRDSMSQTEKWFDAISPSSSKSDIFSSSFTAGRVFEHFFKAAMNNICRLDCDPANASLEATTSGDKRYRSLRSNRREPPRPWSNSNAFEGSIAHAMALIESLDDIKSSCAKFREEAQGARWVDKWRIAINWIYCREYNSLDIIICSIQ